MKVIMTTELDWTVYAELKIDLLEVWDSWNLAGADKQLIIHFKSGKEIFLLDSY